MRCVIILVCSALLMGFAPARARDGVPLAVGLIGGVLLGVAAAAADQAAPAAFNPHDVLPIRRGTWVIENAGMCDSPQPGLRHVYNGRSLRSVFATCSIRELNSFGSDHHVAMTCTGNGARKSREALIRVISDRQIVNASEGVVAGYRWCGP